MIAFSDLSPDIDVLPGEYRRLLGYPPGATPDERVMELDRAARAWYAEHGRPWVHAREINRMDVQPDRIGIGGVAFTAERLRKLVNEAGADRVVVMAVSAGPEAEAYAGALWEEGKPDEYYFIEMYASAVVEHLVMTAGARLCALADGIGAAVLPHDSPGYPGWDVSEQANLLGVLGAAGDGSMPFEIEALDSGMLRPKKSLVAVFGITRHVERVRRVTDLVPCDECALERCQFRRRPYVRRMSNDPERDAIVEAALTPSAPAILNDVAYSVNAKALRRWAAERLTLQTRKDGTIEAAFRYDGTTCTNMGLPIAWDYHVTLGPREAGYPIRAQHSAPAAGDTGHAAMCRYLSHRDELMAAIATERPLARRRLDDVLSWSRAHAAAGCFCDGESRTYKWGLVLETIHYALAQSETQQDTQAAEETRS